MALPSFGFQGGIRDLYNNLWGTSSPWYEPPKPPDQPPVLQPAPPDPANTYGVGQIGMTPEQSQMISPRTQISQALLKQRMGG